MNHETRILRDRQRASQKSLDPARELTPPYGSAAVLGMTTTVQAYPTTAGSFYAVAPQSLNGPETEGAAASYVGVTGGATFYAWNAGTAVPPSGTPVICHAVGGRWVFRYDG